MEPDVPIGLRRAPRKAGAFRGATKAFRLPQEARWDNGLHLQSEGTAYNDEKKEDPKRYADPTGSFRHNLARFITDTRGKGASPMLATPVARRKFDAAGKLVDTHGAYPEAVRTVAKSTQTPLLDLTTATMRWLQAVGNEPSRKFFMWIEPGVYSKIPDGRKDDTHFVEAGATAVAKLATDDIRTQRLPLAKWLKP